MSTYTVKAGDSLSSIARTLYGDANRWKEIASLNQLPSTLIRTGQILQVPDDEIPEVQISQNYTPGYGVTPAAPSVPLVTSPAVTEIGSPEVMQEITVTGRRIDYTIIALLIVGAVFWFSEGSPKSRRRW